jgi:hypothetical protein
MHLRQSWLERSLSALFAVWLAFIVAEPAALHSCPMHGGHGAAAISRPGALGSGSASRERGRPTAHHEHGAPADDDSAQRYCSCLGQCSSAGPGAAVPAAPVLLTDVVIGEVRIAISAGTLRHPVAAEHFLPFANGPPRA